MAAALQKGINAAKAGRMDNALEYLKDAIIEEPQNADVWVWIAAIIDDLEQQEIFLEKALDIDPNNIPAQRGLAYLQKRKRDQAGKMEDHLSDHTRPISPFPVSNGAKKQNRFSDSSKISPRGILEFQDSEQNNNNQAFQPEGQSREPNKLTPFEIGLLSVVVIVFAIIGLLAASAIFEFELPLDFLKRSQPSLSTEPPFPGVFLYENDAFFPMQENQGLPKNESGIPTSMADQPLIVFHQRKADSQEIKLIYQNGNFIPFDTFREKWDTELLQPISALEDGLYCLQHTPDPPEDVAYYWCFKVTTLEDQN
jgi:hypothetical protein